MVKNNQDNDFNDKKLINLDSITLNREPSLDNELSTKKYTDDRLDKNTKVRLNQTLQSYLKVFVGNYTYNLTKYDRTQITDTTIIKAFNSGGDLLQQWNINCKDKNIIGEIQFLLNQQKQTAQQVFLEQRLGLHLVMLSCRLRHHLIITVIRSLFFSNELTLFKLVK